jgi:hypothetical protein
MRMVSIIPQAWKTSRLSTVRTIATVAAVLVMTALAHAQQYGSRIGVERGGEVDFAPQGPGVLFDALDPAVKKWYVPQELYHEYGWQQWQYSNYARPEDQYQRYVGTVLEGDYFYDLYGSFITRGWLLYDWRQAQPQSEGSGIFKSTNFGTWFNALTVSGDSKGQYFYAITVGNQIRTTLTPLTFSKPAFSGVQIDFASDRYQTTVLASRIDDPVNRATSEPDVQTNATTLFGGRMTAQVGDFITVGGTVVDARNANTDLDLFEGDPIAGNLTAGQTSAPLTAIAVILSDDSPDDGEGGAALFAHDVIITSRDFETGDVVRPGGEWPIVFGGFDRGGFLAADGSERIVLNYDFNDPAYSGPNPTQIVAVDFDYVLANDYRVDIWSDRQTGRNVVPTPPLTPETIDRSRPALLTVRRAEGNVKDASNLRSVRFDYGLPTANLITGFTLEGSHIAGFDFYGEWNRNTRYAQYPNAALFNAGKQHEISSETADAWMANVSRNTYPFFAFGEAYSIAPLYSTTAYVVSAGGTVQYDNAQANLYEFVEDNDDQDRRPDWLRINQSGDQAIFPGLDANNDFVNDFNQNDNDLLANTIPDYEEPFLRFSTDRPEFLFGIDMNNNGWIDRYEDDDLPDYPYKPDRRGYNAYVGLHVHPQARLTLGRTDESMISDERHNRMTYALFTLDRSHPRLGRIRVFDMLKRVEDDIPDVRRPASANSTEIAITRPVVVDVLPAQDTWVNTLWIGADYTGVPGLEVENVLKHEIYHQNRSMRDLDGRPLRDTSSLTAVINRLDYGFDIGRLNLRPRLKNEYFRNTPFHAEERRQEQWTLMGVLLLEQPVLSRTLLQGGLEMLWKRDLVLDEDEMVDLGVTDETGDLNSITLAVQLSSTSDYLGYRLTTQLGVRFGTLSQEFVRQRPDGSFHLGSERSTETTTFLTVLAGL